jgi:hypothetical protein
MRALNGEQSQYRTIPPNGTWFARVEKMPELAGEELWRVL